MAMPVLLLLRRAPIPTTSRRRTSFVITVVVLVVLGVLAAGLFARPAHASTFTVTNTNDSGAGSLRKAMEDANNNGAGADTIKFNIPESDPNCTATTHVCTISSGSPMPQITGKVTIDGYSQGKGTKDTTEDDAKPNTLAVGNDAVLKIELNGTGSAPGATGLWISAAKSTVKGLVINGWEQGIRISGSGATGNKVEGNFIGTDASGTKDPGANNPANTSLFGVTISEAPGNTVGGTRPAQRNIISGNDQHGIAIGFAGATGNKVMGNYIGTDKDGDDDLGNSANGVFVHGGATTNTIGGTKAKARNVISGNDQFGVFGIDTTGNKVMGNYIGTDASGTQALGNFADGVIITSGAHNNTIGGTKTTMRNIISGNGRAGVGVIGNDTTGNKVMGNYIGTDASGTQALGNSADGVIIIGSSATGNRILSNSINYNDDLGIDLNNDGFTINDSPAQKDVDSGPNNLQNYPVITSAVNSGKKTVIEGTLNSTANITFTVQFFSSLAANPGGYGEGQKFIGELTGVTTDGSGNASFTVTAPAVPAGQVVTATATNEITGDTSEFSAAKTVVQGP